MAVGSGPDNGSEPGSERRQFVVGVSGGSIGGWVAGQGIPLVLLHGGPGLGYEYLDDLATELSTSYRVASFQQRGLEPSTTTGPYTVAQALADVVAVLDHLRWDRAVVAGHSWGGTLALRLAAAHPERLLGVLGIDAIGIVGDGGMAAFSTELRARASKRDAVRLAELKQREQDGDAAATIEALRILGPLYFADPTRPPIPDPRFSLAARTGLLADRELGAEQAAERLAKGDLRYGLLAGAGSPIPWGQAARPTVDLSPLAFLSVVPNAGHFPWIEAPGSVQEALARLLAD
jgi:pimeloyl-ACP methyl ester carboxylesterase